MIADWAGKRGGDDQAPTGHSSYAQAPLENPNMSINPLRNHAQSTNSAAPASFTLPLLSTIVFGEVAVKLGLSQPPPEFAPTFWSGLKIIDQLLSNAYKQLLLWSDSIKKFKLYCISKINASRLHSPARSEAAATSARQGSTCFFAEPKLRGAEGKSSFKEAAEDGAIGCGQSLHSEGSHHPRQAMSLATSARITFPAPSALGAAAWTCDQETLGPSKDGPGRSPTTP
ncbi:hypothetical protein BDZ45DRAFT_741273 [Acephala macrosclerotiorum]|nr:hypothetical protein BDZ45DRAFT_741273 [Acephala macrosclerotiorum]